MRKSSIAGSIVLLALLACPWRAASCSAQVSRGLMVETEAEGQLRRRAQEALQTSVTLDFRDTPLSEAMETLQAKIGVSFRLDAKALEDSGIRLDMPVTFNVSDMTARSALRRLLGRMELTYLARDESILVTTQEKAGADLIVQVYLVRDLVEVQDEDGLVEDPESLIDTLTSIVSPTSWDEVGGPGSVSYFRNAGVLVVSQTDEVHEQIAELLTQLRTARDLQNGQWRGALRGGDASGAIIGPGQASVEQPAWQVPRVYR